MSFLKNSIFVVTFFISSSLYAQTYDEVITAQQNVNNRNTALANKNVSQQRHDPRGLFKALSTLMSDGYVENHEAPKSTATILNSAEMTFARENNFNISNERLDDNSLYKWVGKLFLKHNDKNKQFVEITLMKYMPYVVQNYKGANPFFYFYPTEENQNILVSLQKTSFENFEAFKKDLAVNIIREQFRGASFPTEQDVLPQVQSSLQKIFEVLPLISADAPEGVWKDVQGNVVNKKVPATATSGLAAQIFRLAQPDITYTAKLPFRQLTADDINFIRAKINAVTPAPDQKLLNFVNGNNLVNSLGEVSAHPFYIWIYDLARKNSVSEEEKAQLDAISRTFAQSLFKDFTLTPASGQTPTDLVTENTPEFYQHVIDLAAGTAQFKYSSFRQRGEKGVPSKKDEISSDAQQYVLHQLKWVLSDISVVNAEPFTGFFANAHDVVFGLDSVPSLINIEQLKTVFMHLVKTFDMAVPTVMLTVEEKAFIDSKSELYNDTLKELQAQLPALTKVPNFESMRYEGSVFMVMSALVAIKQQAIDADKSMVEAIEKKISEILLHHLKGTEIIPKDTSTISGYAYDPALLSSLGKMNPADLLNLGATTQLDLPAHFGLLMLYSLSAVSAEYLDKTKTFADIEKQKYEIAAKAARHLGMMIGWSLNGQNKFLLDQMLATDAAQAIGLMFYDLYAQTFDEARKAANVAFIDPEDDQKQKAFEDAQKKANLPVIDSSDFATHGPMTTYHGDGIFTVDQRFMDARGIILAMNDYSYAVSKALVYELNGNAEKQKFHTDKRDRMATEFAQQGWEFKYFEGVSGVENPQRDIMGFVAYHPALHLMVHMYHGSSSAADWEDNFDMLKINAKEEARINIPGNYHRGFLRNYMTGRDNLTIGTQHFMNKMTEEQKAKLKVVISGQSQGGGLSTIAAADMAFNLSKTLFGADYNNAESHRIYAWLLASARAADPEAADAINEKFGTLNIIRQNAVHDPVPVTPLDDTGHEFIKLIPVLGEKYIAYTGYKSVGVLALSETYNDEVQARLDLAMGMNKERTLDDIKALMSQAAVENPVGFAKNALGVLQNGGLRIGATLLAPLHMGDAIAEGRGTIGAFDQKAVAMNMERMLYDGWLSEKTHYENLQKKAVEKENKGTGQQPTTPEPVDPPTLPEPAQGEIKITNNSAILKTALSQEKAGKGEDDPDVAQIMDEYITSYTKNKAPMADMGQFMGILSKELIKYWDQYDFAWLLTKSGKNNPREAAQNCLDQYEDYPKFQAHLDRGWAYNSATMITTTQPNGDAEHVCAMMFSDPK